MQAVPPNGDRKLVRSSTDSAARLAGDRAQVAAGLRSSKVEDRIGQVMHPKSLSGSMKKVGIALIAAPDPITGVPGVALLASSYAMKKREPADLSHLAKETKKVLREMATLRI